MGHPVKFTPPSFAKKLTEEQLAKRIHCVQMRDTINCDDSPNPEEYKRASMTSSACVDYGYWWLELCGDGEDIITEYEAIRDDLIAYAYGIWDHIKNNKEGIHEHHAENYALEWVGALPGVRESRRLVGDYMLSETDILEHIIFEDAVCYGGWCVGQSMRRTDYWISTCFLLTVIFMTAYTRSLIALTIRKILRTCTWREEISVCFCCSIPGCRCNIRGYCNIFPCCGNSIWLLIRCFLFRQQTIIRTDMVTTATFGDEEILPLDILRSQNAVTLIKRRVKKPVFKKQTDDTADGIVVRTEKLIGKFVTEIGVGTDIVALARIEIRHNID